MSIKKKKITTDNSEFQDEPFENIDDDLPETRMKKIDSVEQKVSQKYYDRVFIQQWKNRRWMAWISLISIIFFTSAALFYIPIEKLEATDNLLSWYYTAATGVIIAYMGLSTWATIQDKKDK